MFQSMVSMEDLSAVVFTRTLVLLCQCKVNLRVTDVVL